MEDFAKTRDLKDILPLLRKGALVARDPTNYEDIEGAEALEDDEVECLRNEVLHKWKQPRPLYFTIICCSVGAAVQGWDQTGTGIYVVYSVKSAGWPLGCLKLVEPRCVWQASYQGRFLRCLIQPLFLSFFSPQVETFGVLQESSIKAKWKI